VTSGQAIQRLARGELLADVALELDRMGAVLGHGPYIIPQRPGTLVNPKTSSVRLQGRTPTSGEDHSGTDKDDAGRFGQTATQQRVAALRGAPTVADLTRLVAPVGVRPR